MKMNAYQKLLYLWLTKPFDKNYHSHLSNPGITCRKCMEDKKEKKEKKG